MVRRTGRRNVPMADMARNSIAIAIGSATCSGRSNFRAYGRNTSSLCNIGYAWFDAVSRLLVMDGTIVV
jgi:hypothetical protein